MRYYALMVVLFWASAASAQIKIGEIEVSERLAGEYFLDCYDKPDTVRVYIVLGVRPASQPPYYDDLGNRYFNKETILKAYPRGYAGSETLYDRQDKALYFIFLKTRTPSEDDFAEWFRLR